MNELKYYKRPIFKKGKLVYRAYVAMDYLDSKNQFDIYVYIKKRFLWFFWVKVHEYSTRNLEPKEATRVAIKQYESTKEINKENTQQLNTHIINFMSWDGELDK